VLQALGKACDSGSVSVGVHIFFGARFCHLPWPALLSRAVSPTDPPPPPLSYLESSISRPPSWKENQHIQGRSVWFHGRSDPALLSAVSLARHLRQESPPSPRSSLQSAAIHGSSVHAHKSRADSWQLRPALLSAVHRDSLCLHLCSPPRSMLLSAIHHHPWQLCLRPQIARRFMAATFPLEHARNHHRRHPWQLCPRPQITHRFMPPAITFSSATPVALPSPAAIRKGGKRPPNSPRPGTTSLQSPCQANRLPFRSSTHAIIIAVFPRSSLPLPFLGTTSSGMPHALHTRHHLFPVTVGPRSARHGRARSPGPGLCTGRCL
jgi:hypothetical protein